MRKQNLVHVYLGSTTLILTTLAIAATLCACTKILTQEIRTARRIDEFAAMERRVQT